VDQTLDFERLLAALTKHGVDFIVVGGVCAVLHGAPIATFDLDVVHRRTPENIGRLLRALKELGAYYRGQGTRRLVPRHSHLESPGHQLLMTNHGPLDLLGTIGTNRSFEELVGFSSELQLGELRIRILDLETLIAIKEETGHAKDKAVLEVLRKMLET
jgi:hypothetical protein